MKKKISSKIVSIVFAILIICFAIAFYAVGWTDPTANPPGGNVAPPINTGNIGQSKAGGLILNTGGATNGLIVDQGNVGIGTTSPAVRLHVAESTSAAVVISVTNSTTGSTGSDGFTFGIGSDESASIVQYENNNMYFGTNGPTADMTIHSSGNVGIGTTSPSAGTGGQLKLDVEGNVGADMYCDKDGNNCKESSYMWGSLGSWESKNENTVYQAATDGFVTAFANMTGTIAEELQGLTDSNNPPTTVRVSVSNFNTLYNGFTMPVRKGHYWKVQKNYPYGGISITIYWISLGP